MIDATKDIVIAMIQNGYIERCSDTDKNIESVKKVIQQIYKQLSDSKNQQ